MTQAGLWQILFVVLWIVAIFALKIAQRNRRVENSFRKLMFRTPEGEVRSDEVHVVKEVLDSVHGDDPMPVGSFRYCVGPGPTYFVAICQTVGYTLWRKEPILEWAVRPLTAERMRHALAGDEHALRAAFGDVVHDRLHA